jgi:hypothetical protein
MRTTLRHLGIAILAFGVAISAAGQHSSATAMEFQGQLGSSPSVPLAPAIQPNFGTSVVAPGVQQLLDFRDSDVKFDLRDLMSILQDRRHEGWVLAAYPDPKTSRPLIGAGFSLDLAEREHPQRDPLNPHAFLEPSSAQLWQAAGLDPERLQNILQQYNDDLAAWTKRIYRKKIRTLTPQITSDEATNLLRISVIQAIYNARAYCRNFDRLTASQQMALTQLVYQMGVNLEEFDQFLSLINDDSGAEHQVQSPAGDDAEHWKTVQDSLIQSQWARLYRARAVSVIAMLDPQYLNGPSVAERRISVKLRPAVVHRRATRSGGSLRVVSYNRHLGRSVSKKTSRVQSKKRI